MEDDKQEASSGPTSDTSPSKPTIDQTNENSTTEKLKEGVMNEEPSTEKLTEGVVNEEPSTKNLSEEELSEEPFTENLSEEGLSEEPSTENLSEEGLKEEPSTENLSDKGSNENQNSLLNNPTETSDVKKSPNDAEDVISAGENKTNARTRSSSMPSLDEDENSLSKGDEIKPSSEDNTQDSKITDEFDKCDKQIDQTESNTDTISKENISHEKTEETNIEKEPKESCTELESSENDSTENAKEPTKSSEIFEEKSITEDISKESESIEENKKDSCDKSNEGVKEKEDIKEHEELSEASKNIKQKDDQLRDQEESQDKGSNLPTEQSESSEQEVPQESLESKENKTLETSEDENKLLQEEEKSKNEISSESNTLEKQNTKETLLPPDSLDGSSENVNIKRDVDTPKNTKRRSTTRHVSSQPPPPQTWYFLSDQKDNDVKGFTLEYYDSTIYMYQNYVDHVTKEIKSDYKLPKYKSELYNNMLAKYNASIKQTTSVDKSKIHSKENIPLHLRLATSQTTPSKDKVASSISSRKLANSIKKDTSPDIRENSSPTVKKEVKTAVVRKELVPTKKVLDIKSVAIKKERTPKKRETIKLKIKETIEAKNKEIKPVKEKSVDKEESPPRKKSNSPPKISVRKDILATPPDKELSRREKRNSLALSREMDAYRLPLETYGWKREVVNRNSGQHHSCDIYYYTPTGKKFRSVREIIEYLPNNSELGAYNFTFIKEPIGLKPPLEVVKDANSRTLVHSDKPKGTPGRKPKALSNKVISSSPESLNVSETIIETKHVNGTVRSTVIKKPLVNGTAKPGLKRSREDEDKEDSPKSKIQKTSPTLTDTKLVKRGVSTPTSSTLPRTSKSITITPVIHLKTKDKDKSLFNGDDSPSPPNENKTLNVISRKNKSLSISAVASKKRKLNVEKDESVQVSEDLPEVETVVKPVVRTNDQNTQTIQGQISRSDTIARVARNNKYLVNDLSNQFNALIHLCKYLRVEDLLRVARVNRLFNAAAHSHLLWHTVRLKNSKIRNWENFSNCLIRHNTHTLDMLKMIGSSDPDENDHIWNQFYRVIGKMHTLKRLELGRVTSTEILNTISNCSKHLAEFSVIAQKSATIDLKLFQGLPNLELLQLRSYETKREYGLIMMNIPILANMKHLRHLSLTGVKNLKSYQINFLKDFPPLESLELGDCTKLDERFPESSLAHLKSLVRLRLEIVHGNLANKCVEVMATLPNLKTIELINIDVKKGFDNLFGQLTHVENILIFPTYVTQSSNTNWLVLSGLSKLKNNLKVLTWGFTQELLRVTNLFIEQWNAQKNQEDFLQINPKEINLPSKEANSIPVLKPLPAFFENSMEEDEQGLVNSGGKDEKKNVSQLDILPLDTLKVMLEKRLTHTKVDLITVSVSLTTRISLPNH